MKLDTVILARLDSQQKMLQALEKPFLSIEVERMDSEGDVLCDSSVGRLLVMHSMMSGFRSRLPGESLSRRWTNTMQLR